MNSDMTAREMRIIGAILDEKNTLEAMAQEYDQMGDRGAAITTMGHAGVADRIYKSVTEVLTGPEVA